MNRIAPAAASREARAASAPALSVAPLDTAGVAYTMHDSTSDTARLDIAEDHTARLNAVEDHAAHPSAPAELRWYALCNIGAHTDHNGHVVGYWMRLLSASTDFRETLQVYCTKYLFGENVSLHVCTANPETIPAGNMRSLPQMTCTIRNHTLKFRVYGHTRLKEFDIFEKAMIAIRPQFERFAASVFSERMRTNCFLSCLCCTNERLRYYARHTFDLDTGILTSYRMTTEGEVRLPLWQ